MSNKNANIGARLDRLPNSGWHIKMWLVSAFALLVCWSNGIGGAVQNVLLNELHWLEPGSTLLAMWGTTYTAGQLFGALVGGPIGDKIGRKKSILLYEVIHIIAMIGGAAAPNVTVLYVFRLIQGFGLGALLVVLFAAFTEYVPGKNRGVWSSRNSFIGNFAHPICNGIALVIVSTGVSMNMNWRIQYIIPSVLSIIASIIIYNKYPESPRWLESQGRVEEADAIMTSIEKEIEGFVETGFDQELKAHEDVYKNMWENADIQITGDDELNRAVRFNIFHLMSTGNEHDDHVNVGAKLLTGEEYGGHAFWDTELFMLPFSHGYFRRLHRIWKITDTIFWMQRVQMHILFLFHSSVMAVAQASGEVGTDSVVCIRASGYPKDFAGIASVAKETFHFPFQYQTGERHRHFRLFLHRDSELCFFLREVYSGFQGFLSIAG